MSAFAPLLVYERTYLGHRAKTAFDPKRSFDDVSLAVDRLGEAMNSIFCRWFVDTKG
jgi:hypothetical protein